MMYEIVVENNHHLVEYDLFYFEDELKLNYDLLHDPLKKNQ